MSQRFLIYEYPLNYIRLTSADDAPCVNEVVWGYYSIYYKSMDGANFIIFVQSLNILLCITDIPDFE